MVKDMYEPEAKGRAQWMQSGMILDALRRPTDALNYFRYLKNKAMF
jgi:farnesyl-diphosphate farnesyltransferase